MINPMLFSFQLQAGGSPHNAIWRNTEPNPRPQSEPDGNALALRAWIRRFGRLRPDHDHALCLASRVQVRPGRACEFSQQAFILGKSS